MIAPVPPTQNAGSVSPTQNAKPAAPAPAVGSPAALPRPVRVLLVGLAIVLVAIGVIGLFVPGLPTTVFILMAGWCAARGSTKLHDWMLGHKLFGPMIADWQAGGYVSRSAKRAAASTMAICAVILALTVERPWSGLGIGMMAVVLVWLWRRPER